MLTSSGRHYRNNSSLIHVFSLYVHKADMFLPVTGAGGESVLA